MLFRSGTRWALFVAGWTTGLAYGVATIFYQAATFSQHPASSAAWIGGMLAAFAAVIVAMRVRGQRRSRTTTIPLEAAQEA